MNWKATLRVENATPGFHVLEIDGKRVVLAILDGDVVAFDAICPHAGGPMEFAETNGLTISCPLHSWRFDLANGGKELHGYRDLPMYDTRVENGIIYIAAPNSAISSQCAGDSCNPE